MNLNASSSSVPTEPLFVKLKSSSRLSLKNINSQVSGNTVVNAKKKNINSNDSQPRSGLDHKEKEQSSGMNHIASNTMFATDSMPSSPNLNNKGLLTCPSCGCDRPLDHHCYTCKDDICWYCSVTDENNVECCNRCVITFSLDSSVMFQYPRTGVSDMYTDPIESTPPTTPPKPAILKRTRTELKLKNPKKKISKTNSEQEIKTKDVFRELREYVHKQIDKRTFAEISLLRKHVLEQFMNHDCYLDQLTFNLRLDEYLEEYQNVPAERLEPVKTWIEKYSRMFPDRDQVVCTIDFFEAHLFDIERHDNAAFNIFHSPFFRSYFAQWMNYFNIPSQKKSNFITIVPPSNGFIMKL